MALNIGGPHRGHAAGNTDVEKQASQLASDVKLKVKQKMGPHTDKNPAQVAQAYERQLASSPAPGPVKAIARKKLKIGVTEQYGISELAKQSTVNALLKVFVEGVTVEEVEDIAESDEKKYWIVVTDKKTGNTYRRQATRAKIAELRSNPNIRRVEMTGYHPKETDDKQGQKTSKVKSGKGLDPVGQEDSDPNNNGVKNDKSDKYLLKRRAAIGNAIEKKKTVSASYEPEGEIVEAHKKADKKKVKKWWDDDGDGIGWEKGEVKKEEFFPEAKKAKKKSDTITGEGVNNSKYINTKPTMEQHETPVSSQKPDSEEQQKIKLRQKQVQAALNRQRQTMQLQRTGRLPLNYSDDYTPEGELVDEKLATQYGNPGKLSQSSQRKSLGRRSSIKDGSKPTGYESPREFRDTESKYQKNSFELEGENVQEVAPPGFENTVKAMKKHPELSGGKTPKGKDKNIYALAWFMKNKGYKSHEEAASCEMDEKPKLKKSEGGSEDPREIPTKVNLVKNKFRAMGLKMSYEPEGKIVSEEESDKIRDRQLERGGMGARASQSPAKTGSSKPFDPKKHQETTKKAMDLVRQSIIARHGKGALM
jgi:hypothetical protein